MAFYTNTLTENKNIWIENNISTNYELASYDSPTMEHNGNHYTFVLAYFQDDLDRFYSIQPLEKLECESHFTVVAPLDCLKIKNLTKRRQAIIELITEDYENN